MLTMRNVCMIFYIKMYVFLQIYDIFFEKKEKKSNDTKYLLMPNIIFSEKYDNMFISRQEHIIYDYSCIRQIG